MYSGEVSPSPSLLPTTPQDMNTKSLKLPSSNCIISHRPARQASTANTHFRSRPIQWPQKPVYPRHRPPLAALLTPNSSFLPFLLHLPFLPVHQPNNTFDLHIPLSLARSPTSHRQYRSLRPYTLPAPVTIHTPTQT